MKSWPATPSLGLMMCSTKVSSNTCVMHGRVVQMLARSVHDSVESYLKEQVE